MALRRVLAGILVLLMLVLALCVVSAQDGDAVMDTGFRPETDGFSFENYTDESGEVNLTSVEMVRLFGETVCAGKVDNQGGCKLTPNAKMWMEETSSQMADGHCEGMATLSLLFYAGTVDVTQFGADATADLTLEGNDDLRREIAFWWATQMTSPTYDNVIEATPTAIVQELIDGMDKNLYTIGIYLPDYTGGHAITPYAVVDLGDGIYHVMVYDNNYPGEERFIEVDTSADTWVYTGSTNPDEEEAEYYGSGDDQTFDLTPMGPREGMQECEFCGDAGNYGDEEYTSVSLNGRGNLVVTDAKGRRAGILNGKLVNDIPGAKVRRGKSGLSWFRPPVIILPADLTFRASISRQDGSGRPATGLIISRRGSVTTINGITPGDIEDTLTVDGDKIGYQSGEDEDTLTFRQGTSAQSGQDFFYEFTGASTEMNFTMDPADGQFELTGDDDGSTFDTTIEYYDEEGNGQAFHDDDWAVNAEGGDLMSPDEWQESSGAELVDIPDDQVMTDEPVDDGGNTGDDTSVSNDGSNTGDDGTTGDDTGSEVQDDSSSDTGNETGSDTGSDDSGDTGGDAGDDTGSSGG